MSASAFDIAASGMAAHRAEMDLIAENIANAGVTRAGGVAFHPRAPVFESAGDGTFAGALQSALGSVAPDGFTFADVDLDADGAFGFAMPAQAEPEPVRLAGIAQPPASEADDSIGQMVSLVAAGRAYDADVAALQAAKQMGVEAIDVDRS